MVYTKLVLFSVFAALLTGCGSTMQARNVQPSGFLGEHRSLLTAGEKGKEALVRYRNPKTNWASYDKIVLEPIAIWDDPTRGLSTEQREDLQRLADSFYNTLHQKLSKDYRLVAKPTPGAMRIQAAITHGEKSTLALTFASKAVWQLQAVNTLWTGFSGKPAFAGEVTVEFKVQDADTGELLAAGIDRRVGGQQLFEKEVFNSWGDVKNSLEFWADATVHRLCTLRGQSICEEPRAGLDILHF
ncbi:MAG: DUF3313 domain-containing protein [Nitrospiraceae bacterium]